MSDRAAVVDAVSLRASLRVPPQVTDQEHSRATDEFVHRATRAFAHGTPAPPAPEDDLWVLRAIEAGVLAPVVRALQRSGHPVPHGLSRLPLEAAARHLRTMDELAGLVDGLDRAGVRHAVLKGPVLRSVVFEQKDVRDYADLDLLVGPRQLRATLRVLGEQGATLLPTDWEHATRARTAELALAMPNGTMLDLHCHLLNRGRVREGYHIVTEELLDRAVVRDLSGARAMTLDDLDLVLHVLIHACLSGCHQLRWLLDVQQCTQWLDAHPGDLARRAREMGVELPARAALDAVADHLDERASGWAEAVGRATPWTSALQRIGRNRPPSAPSRSARTARTWYAATRRSDVRSWRSAAGSAARAVRYARSPWPAPRRLEAALSDPGLQTWLSQAEQLS